MQLFLDGEGGEICLRLFLDVFIGTAFRHHMLLKIFLKLVYGTNEETLVLCYFL
jgi:hypothetical protein